MKMMTTDIRLDESILTTQDTTRLTHIVDCPDEWNEEGGAQAWVDHARANHLEVTALCGHAWVPESDPVRHPICQPCLDIAQIRLA